jgi:pimeloyl-ACP methyl ester carboxylesterase
VASNRELPRQHEADVELRDGRRLTYSAAGDPAGFPVYYLHGAIGSPRWRTPALDSLIARLGILYLVPNRPGFAGSDPRPGRTVADFARDVEDLADALGHRWFSVVGVSAGAPYALACAWAMPERVTAIAAASPMAPPSGPGASPGLRYGIPRLAFGAPGLGAPIADATLRAMGLRRATAPRAMIEDYEVCRRPWGFDPGEVPGPVNLWHGRRDVLVPVAHALRLAEAIPSCATFLEPRGGHFFFSRRLAEIIAPLSRPQPFPAPPFARRDQKRTYSRSCPIPASSESRIPSSMSVPSTSSW